MARFNADRLARHIARGGGPAWTPRVPQLSMHMGTLTGVDLFNGVVDFQSADPTSPVMQGVPYLRSYSDLNNPQEDHVVWAAYYDKQLIVLGQHVRQTNIVVP